MRTPNTLYHPRQELLATYISKRRSTNSLRVGTGLRQEQMMRFVTTESCELAPNTMRKMLLQKITTHLQQGYSRTGGSL